MNVPCDTLTDIFLSHGMRHIDFFSLDVEKHATVSLHSLDFNQIDVSSLLVEWRVQEDRDILTKAGYTLVDVTTHADGYRGYRGDVLAFKPERFPHLCSV